MLNKAGENGLSTGINHERKTDNNRHRESQFRQLQNIVARKIEQHVSFDVFLEETVAEKTDVNVDETDKADCFFHNSEHLRTRRIFDRRVNHEKLSLASERQRENRQNFENAATICVICQFETWSR